MQQQSLLPERDVPNAPKSTKGRVSNAASGGSKLALQVAFAGTSCSVATLFTHPIDVIKVQRQIVRGDLVSIVRRFTGTRIRTIQARRPSGW